MLKTKEVDRYVIKKNKWGRRGKITNRKKWSKCQCYSPELINWY